MKDSQTRLFDLPSILTGVSGVRVSRKLGGVDAVLQFMTGDKSASVTHSSDGMSFPSQVKAEILAQHPELEETCAVKPKGGEFKSWFARCRTTYGDHLFLHAPKP